MGMYTNFNWEDIEVNDYEGLKGYLELFNSIDKDGKEEPNSGWNKWFKDIIPSMLDTKENTITFECWTDIKLISYYYTPYLIFFDGLAKYIEGEVHWIFENDDEAGYVEFRDGKTTMHTGNMKWEEWNPIENIREREMTKDMKKILLLNKLDMQT